jgi:hypothetical protein
MYYYVYSELPVHACRLQQVYLGLLVLEQFESFE